ncbi:hypothetical protein NQ317_019648 [Molorchus minor]|uniref:Lipase domain-containing protein n=1 Tax=Molorchus minor TaxID=1323400 RepID=A0ABQ9IUZ9_9CUCU|nr:hypothetical protein NQ317_019648 [Molorchus minor]
MPNFPSDLTPEKLQTRQSTLNFGPCRIVVNPTCPDPDVTFYLWNRQHPEPQPVEVGTRVDHSNLIKINFNPSEPSKIIIHGYNSDMLLNALAEIRKEYLKTTDYNVFTVNWSPLNRAPCYVGALINVPHVGTCTAQLVERIRQMGGEDIHVIGFSLGAHVANYMANALRPYKVPRITGLDPAFPGFITPDREAKLDKTDAQFVDVYHTNAFIQGKVEESDTWTLSKWRGPDLWLWPGSNYLEDLLGDVPLTTVLPFEGCGCNMMVLHLTMPFRGVRFIFIDFFACNHHRAALYYAESINTAKGFWGWPCPAFFQYLLGRCPIHDPQIIMGEYINKAANGVYLVITESVAPYAVGKYDGPDIEIFLKADKNRLDLLRDYKRRLRIISEKMN